MRGVTIKDRVLLVGQTGMGKTTIARYLADGLQPVRTIVCDPKGELHFGGVRPVRQASRLANHVHEPFIHWIPARLNRDELEEGFETIHAVPGPRLVWVDEMAAVSNPHWVPEGLKLDITQGRQAEQAVIACTQRLTECHPVIRSQAEHIIVVVPAPIELDLKTLAGQLGRESKTLRAELEELERAYGLYSHLWYVRPGNELRRCAPLPAAPARRPPRAAEATVDAGGAPLADAELA